VGQDRHAAWACADPGLQFDTTINEWHTCPADGRINASNPCSEYMFLDDTACNLASLNLMQVPVESGPNAGDFDVEAPPRLRLWTIVLEISVLMAQFPSEEIAELLSYEVPHPRPRLRQPRHLLHAARHPVRLRRGGRDLRRHHGAHDRPATRPAPRWPASSAPSPATPQPRAMLRVIRNHRRAAYGAPAASTRAVDRAPVPHRPRVCPTYLLERRARRLGQRAALGEQHGYRNAQVTVIAPTGTIGLLMDCDTTGIEPDFALVKFKKLAGGGYFKIINQSVPAALRGSATATRRSPTSSATARAPARWSAARGSRTPTSSARASPTRPAARSSRELAGAFEIGFVFNRYVLGDEFCRDALGLTDAQLAEPAVQHARPRSASRARTSSAPTTTCAAP
jgi:ribonucleoside-diphosphate reductase alpha chain